MTYLRKKRMLADILWQAANENLSTDNYWAMHYSCDAVYRCFIHPDERAAALAHLEGMGCPIGCINCFEEFKEGSERQGVRYMWLLLAMHVAQDEGIEL